MAMDPFEILKKFCEEGTKASNIIKAHSSAVAEKAAKAAEKVKHMPVDLDFIYESSILHDIGIIKTNVPSLGCHGTHPYICHGFLGREILDTMGLFRHGLVCERHVGVGLTQKQISDQNLPLPKREMVPVSMEEIIVCYADKFFSKGRGQLLLEKSLEEITEELSRHGKENAEIFTQWVKMFEK